ncbi:aldehyde dehydrogenase family protein [Williamsia muralis]|uniref:aldehyde dehydrogenase family protein n=1 Tax=Williamsia marianensis TaxID=85044 RepID=UPI00382E1A44
MGIKGMNFIGGRWTPARSGATFERYNPANSDDLVGTFPSSDEDDVSAAVDGLVSGFAEWSCTAPEARAATLEAAADLLADRAESLVAELIREEGKTAAEARMEVGRTPMNLRFYAGEAVRSTGNTYPAPGQGLVYTVREPFGVIGAITPWNFPLNIPSRKIGPALAAGNTVLFKPSELTPLMGQRLVEALLDAGLPANAIALVHGDGKAGAAVVADERVTAVTFTGSTEVGRRIHREVGPARRVQLEMGGKNPVVVLDDADLDKAAALIVKGAFGLSGQACTGTSRVIAAAAIHDELVRKVVALAEALTVGAGTAAGVAMGPLASQDQLAKFMHYVEVGKDEGAQLVSGGERLQHDEYSRGFFARPAVFTDTARDMRIVTEEVFGPLLAFQRAQSFDDAVELANATSFGLSASIVTGNLARATMFADRSRTGLVKINQPTTGMAMNAPFGGYKDSSTQTFKEQAGPTLMQFYQSEKTIYLNPAL